MPRIICVFFSSNTRQNILKIYCNFQSLPYHQCTHQPTCIGWRLSLCFTALRCALLVIGQITSARVILRNNVFIAINCYCFSLITVIERKVCNHTVCTTFHIVLFVYSNCRLRVFSGCPACIIYSEEYS